MRKPKWCPKCSDRTCDRCVAALDKSFYDDKTYNIKSGIKKRIRNLGDSRFKCSECSDPITRFTEYHLKKLKQNERSF